MELLKLAIILGAVAGIAKGIQLFGRHCQHRFGYRLFTARGFWLAAFGINLLWWGYVAWGTAFLHHGQTSGGMVLMAMGLAAVAWLLYENVRDTSLLYGVGGSALQLVLFFPAALYGIPLLAITLLFLLFATFKAGPAWFIDRE
ncbi:putative membrane protein [Burkholderia cenocepacia]|uniref:Membrane protein n=1 Tax=Burkholderia cenocepacia TaxID=95486 RepID=A0AAN0RWV5_9BURK|nr:putative membrane protein [Burkholderia cenocepacia]